MRLSAIAAVAENYVIGRNNELPWRLPADLRWFVKHTRGKPIIFGRKTYESTGYLKGRQNIVVTRNGDWSADCDAIASSVDDAIALAGDVEEVMFIGGSGIYREILPRLDRLYLTVVHARPIGDTYFPRLDESQWRVESREFRAFDDANPCDMTFIVLDRETYGEVSRVDALLPYSLRCGAESA